MTSTSSVNAAVKTSIYAAFFEPLPRYNVSGENKLQTSSGPSGRVTKAAPTTKILLEIPVSEYERKGVDALNAARKMDPIALDENTIYQSQPSEVLESEGDVVRLAVKQLTGPIEAVLNVLWPGKLLSHSEHRIALTLDVDTESENGQKKKSKKNEKVAKGKKNESVAKSKKNKSVVKSKKGEKVKSKKSEEVVKRTKKRKLTDAPEVETVDTSIRLDDCFKVNGENNDYLFIIEYKKPNSLDRKKLARALVPRNAPESVKNEKMERNTAVDKPIKGNMFYYVKQAAGYGIKCRCSHVALFDMRGLLLLNFENIVQLDEAAQIASATWIDEKDLGQGQGQSRIAMLGFAVMACEQTLGPFGPSQ